MLPQTSAEAVHSAIYVQHYLDCVENFPDYLQRYLTRVRELDVSYRACLREVDANAPLCVGGGGEASGRRARAAARVQRALVAAQELGDERLQLVQVVQDLIDNKTREIDLLFRNFKSCVEVNTNGTEETPAAAEPPPAPPPPAPVAPPPPRAASPAPPPLQEREKEKNDRDKTGERWSKRARRSRTATSNNAGAHTDGDSGERDNTERTGGQHNNTTHKKGIGKKKKRKARGTAAAAAAAAAARAETPPEEADAIDPDEPRYCLCDQISFGEMILCDNDLCPIEWFHFSCVSLTIKPKGKWFCPKCRGDRPNVMKPKGQFLKELERYNREKEEKA